MSKPFTMTLNPDARPIKLKPGWYRRAIASERAADKRRVYMAPKARSCEANDRAIQYATWLASRDGIALPDDSKVKVLWESSPAGERPRFVVWSAPKSDPVSIALPHWDYVAPDIIETVDEAQAPWTAPVVRELSGAERAAILDAFACEGMTTWCEAVGPSYADPAPWEVLGTVDAPEGLDGTGPAPDAPEAPPAPTPPAPDAPSARKRAPRKVRGGGGGGGTPAVGIADVTPAVEIPTPPPVEAIADPVEAIELEPIPSTFGDDEPVLMPDNETHPVTVHCHSPRARAAVFERIMDGTFPSDGVQAKAGSFRLTYADAVACDGLPSVRFTGMPRKAYTRRPAPLPGKITVHRAPFHIPAGAFTPAGAMAGMPATLHAPSI